MLYKVIISLIFIGIVLIYYPISNVLAIFKQVDIFTAFFVFVLLFLNLFISSIRFNNLIKNAGVSLEFIFSHRINIFSQIFGLFALQTVGQMAFRNIYGSRYSKFSQRFALLTLIEKIVAIFILLIFAIIGALSITHEMFDISNKTIPLIVIAISIILATIASYNLSLTRARKLYSRKIFELIKKLKISHTVIISFFMHLLMLGAYIYLAQSILNDVSIAKIASVFTIVMLSASLPISFAGWGLRELSAGYIFSLLNLDPAIGVFVASVVGVLSLIAMGLHAILINFLSKPIDKNKRINANIKKKNDFHFERIISFIGLCFIPILIGVQLRIPTNTGDITVNLADPIVFVIAISFISLCYQGYIKNTIWRVEKIEIAFICFIAMIIYGWMLGILRFGHTDWATYNRTLGLLVVFSYLLTGTMIAAILDRKIIGTIISIFTISTLVYFIIYSININIFNYDLLKELQWSYHFFSGFMINRNALAFSLSIFLAIAIVFKTHSNKISHEIIIGVICGLIILTVSRTGIAIALGIFILSFIFKVLRVSKFITIVMYTTLFLMCSYILSYFVPFWVSDLLQLDAFSQKELYGNFKLEIISRIHNERIASYQWAFDLWKENLLFGAGLGAFISSHLNEFNTPLTIHNTFLWVLAEMGIIGALLFLPLPLTILSHIMKRFKSGLEWDDLALFMVLVTVVLFSMTHEILYQRVLWFCLGILITNKVLYREMEK